jgi:hypothetical protein
MRREEEEEQAERIKDEFFARHRKRQAEMAADPDLRHLIGYWLFSEVGGSCAKDHSEMKNGIAPFDWPGWKEWQPPFNRECACCLIGINKGRARRMIASGEGFDLTKGVPLKPEER